MENWISVKEAAKIKGCTTANINYYIKEILRAAPMDRQRARDSNTEPIWSF